VLNLQSKKDCRFFYGARPAILFLRIKKSLMKEKKKRDRTLKIRSLAIS